MKSKLNLKHILLRAFSRFWLFIPLMLVSACSNVGIDNAAGYSIMVEVDDKAYEVEPYSVEGITLERGQHQVRIKDITGRIIRDTVFSVEEAGLITFPRQEYLIWTTLYGLQKDRTTLLNEEWTEIEKTRYYGDFNFYDSDVPFIEKTWNHGLDDDLPSSKKLLILSDFVVESKLFRIKDFITTYKKLSDPE